MVSLGLPAAIVPADHPPSTYLPTAPTAEAEYPADPRYEGLRQPLPLLHPARLWWSTLAAGLRLAGHFSDGIRTGWTHGFDSGASLDHVYRNTASGRGALGRTIDRWYLESPGWCGIRWRRQTLETMLDRAIVELGNERDPVHLFDPASGPGRYLVETLRRHPKRNLTAVASDRDAEGLAAGRELARAEAVSDRLRFEQGDAFDAGRLSRLDPKPDIAVVSGLFELFPDNRPVRRTLFGLASAMTPGSILLYTNQPSHPQQALIARVLPNRDGEPWVMRCRSQQEMDELVAGAGFEPEITLTDPRSIFTVSLARRAA